MKNTNRVGIRVFLSLLAVLLCIGVFPFYASALGEAEEPTVSICSELWDGSSVSESLAGDGSSEETAYIIATPADLAYLGKSSHTDTYEGKYIKLTANINMGGHNLYSAENNCVIGDSTYPFKGIFDGQGFTVSNFSVYGTESAGLFAIISGATVKNLCVSAAQIGCEASEGSTSKYAGGIVGQIGSLGGTITGCNVYLSDVKAMTSIGGIVGEAQKATINNCVSSATVSDISENTVAQLMAGGIVGNSYTVLVKDADAPISIENCVNYGSVSVTDEKKLAQGMKSAGGIIGVMSKYDVVSGCCNFGSVYAESTLSRVTSGGIVGRVRAASFSKTDEVTIKNCLNLSDSISVSGTTSNVGLINGYVQTCTLTLEGCASVQTGESMADAGINGAVHVGSNGTSNGALVESEENKNTIATSEADVSAIKESAATLCGTVSDSMAFKAHIAGVQEHSTESALRFIMGVDSLDYKNAEFRITATYTQGGEEKTAYNGYEPITKAYSSVTADGNTVTPLELGSKYLVTMSVTDIPSGVGDITFDIKACVRDLDGTFILVDCGTYTYSSGS